MIDIEQKDDNLLISYYNSEGNIDFEKIIIPKDKLFNWTTNVTKYPDKKIKSHNKKDVYKDFSKKKPLSRYRLEEIIIEELSDEIKNKIYKSNRPEIWYCDIETEVSDDGFPSPELAANPITLICLTDGSDVYLLATKKLSEFEENKIKNDTFNYFKEFNDKKINIHYKYYDNEYRMLVSFFNEFVPKIPFLTGWYFMDFDWKYLTNRAIRTYNIDISVISPTGKMRSDNTPYHRVIVDYMEIYKKWDTKYFKEIHTLDYTAKTILNKTKIKYNGTLTELYETNYRQYVYYNIIDTLLIFFIDKKANTLTTFLNLSSIAKIEIISAFFPVRKTELLSLRGNKPNNVVLIKDDEYYDRIKSIDKNEEDKYKGAFVKIPAKGIHKYVVSYDFASLYPSIKRQFNISPDTYLGKNPNIENMLNKMKYSKCTSGAMYSTEKDSVNKTFLDDLYAQRKQQKNISKNCEQEMSEILEIAKIRNIKI